MGCLPVHQTSKPENVAPETEENERRNTVPEHDIMFWDPRNIGASCSKRYSESTSPERMGPEPQSINFEQESIKFEKGEGKPQNAWINVAEMSSDADASVNYADTQEFEEKVSSVQPIPGSTAQINANQQISGLSGISTIVDHIFPLQASRHLSE